MNLISRSIYYQLLQLWVVSRSFSHDALVVLVYAFVTSRIDPCCSILVGFPLGILGWLDRCSALGSLCELPYSAQSLPTCAMCCTGCHTVCFGFTLHPWLFSILAERPLPPSVRSCSASGAYSSATTGQFLVSRALLAAMQRRAFSCIRNDLYTIGAAFATSDQSNWVL